MTDVFDGVGCSVFLNNRYQDRATAVFIGVDPLVAKTGLKRPGIGDCSKP